jgi:hypothetical protein
MLLVVVLNVVLVHLVLRYGFKISSGETVLGETRRILKLHRPYDVDSWRTMTAAAEFAQDHPGQPLYGEVFFNRKIKFQYPPSSLLVVLPSVHQPTAARLRGMGISWPWILDHISLGLVLLTAGFAAAIVRLALMRTGNSSAAASWLGGAAAFAMTLTFYPIVKAYNLGQIQVWINALIAIVFWSWLVGRKRTAGIVAGLACLLKPQTGLLLVWALYRREWRFAGALAATCLLGVALSILVFGVGNHVDYLQVLAHLSRHGESYFPNQSVNGLLHRMLGNGNNLWWDPHGLPPYNPLVYGGTLGSSLALIALALFAPIPARARGSVFDLAFIVLTCTLASPVAWEHHYGCLLPIYALVLPLVLGGSTAQTLDVARTRDRGIAIATPVVVLVLVSYALTSNFWSITHRLADSRWNFVQSYLFGGALLMLGVLYLLRQRVEFAVVCPTAATPAHRVPIDERGLEAA